MIHAPIATHYTSDMQEQVFRKNEGLILVCQNNADQSFLVFGMNERAHEITGFEESYLKGRNLTEIVPKDIRNTIEEYVEFSEGAPDLASVLNKVRDFRLLNAEGDEIKVNLKIAQAEARDEHYWYRLILRDDSYEKEVESFKRLLSENFKGHEVLDADTGLPDRASILKDLEIAHFHAKDKGFSSCFAIFRLDKYEELRRAYGKAQTMQALKQIGGNLKRNLRGDDTIGRISENSLGLILVDITEESARVVLNRLRWLVASEPLRIPDVPARKVTVGVAFAMIGSQEPTPLLESCEDGLAKDTTPNVMMEK